MTPRRALRRAGLVQVPRSLKLVVELPISRTETPGRTATSGSGADCGRQGGAMGANGADRRLPVPVSPFGPMQIFADRVRALNLRGQPWEALRLADAYECVVRLAGDEHTLKFLLQGRMYC